LAGCVAPPGARRYTQAQLNTAVRAAVADARKADQATAQARQAEIAKIVREEERRRADQEWTKKIADEKAAAARATADSSDETVSAFRRALTQTSLLGNRKLIRDKAKTMEARQLLDLVAAHMDRLGYRFVLLVPPSAVRDVQRYAETKVIESLSPEFSADFADHMEKMSVCDALGLVLRLYGFDVWVSHNGGTVWVGYRQSAPTGVPCTLVEIQVDEKRFIKSDIKPPVPSGMLTE
jgi:hypothetical protein